MQINMNDFVSVKLTEDGKIILESYRFSMKHILENKGLEGFDLPVPKPDENGYFRFQLWNLMYIFGPYIGMEMPIPFENNAIVIEVEKDDGWIRVEDRLPEECAGTVLVCFPNVSPYNLKEQFLNAKHDQRVRTAHYSQYSNTWYIGDMCGVGGTDPTHWMPLPEPPKED